MTPPRSMGIRLVLSLLAVALILLAFAWWRQREDLLKARGENERLARLAAASQPPAGQPQEDAAPPAPGRPAPAVPEGSAGEAGNPVLHTAPSGDVRTPAGMAQAPRASGLVLEGTRVEPAAEGLVTTLRFTPADTEPLGVVAVVFRLSRETPDRILGLESGGAAALESVMTRVSEDGKFAVFHGTTEQAAPIEFALTVSGATTADVRGTCGIGPFDLGISAEGAVARPK